MIERDQNGHRKIRPRPKPANAAQARPTASEPSVLVPAVRYNAAGKRINEAALCTASTVDGEACRAYAIKGSNVCRVHGGAAPQTIRAARVRLAMSTDWLMNELLKVAALPMEDKKIATKLNAIIAALSRAGIGDRSTVELETINKPLTPWETHMRNAMRVIQTVKVRVNDDGTEEIIEDGRSVFSAAPRAITIRRGDPDEDDVVDGEVVEDYGLDSDGEPAPIRYDPEAVRGPVTPPRDLHVSSDATPPAHIRAKTPGYANTGGKRRTASRMTS